MLLKIGKGIGFAREKEEEGEGLGGAGGCWGKQRAGHSHIIQS